MADKIPIVIENARPIAHDGSSDNLSVGGPLINTTLDADGTGNSISNVGSSEVKSELITGQGNVAATGSDKVLISDVSDSDNLKYATCQSIADLGAGAGAGALSLIETKTFANQNAVTFTSNIDGTHDQYVIFIAAIVFSAGSEKLALRTSTDGGSNYDNGATDYAYVYRFNGTNSGAGDIADDDDTLIQLTETTTNTSSRSYDGRIWIGKPADTSIYTNVNWTINGFNSLPAIIEIRGSGVRNSAGDVDALQLFASGGGNIASGRATLYGIKHS